MVSEKKELPKVTMSISETDKTTGMKLTEKYISITADESADSLIKKAKKALKDD